MTGRPGVERAATPPGPAERLHDATVPRPLCMVADVVSTAEPRKPAGVALQYPVHERLVAQSWGDR